ncbi:MAG: septum formation initiator family protein [Bacteroidaceae bacterium]|nr:septum formation initiator family protein [Bacteroidaceae bacterium]
MKKLYNHPYFSRALCYVVLLLLFGVYIFYIDENSISVRMQNKRYIKELRQEIELYQSNYDRDDRIVKQLSTSREVIERIAIEKYNMKREDQDIFIIHEP